MKKKCLKKCLLVLMCAGLMAPAYAEETSACALVSTTDIQTAFGKAVKAGVANPRGCDYEGDGFSITLTHIDYHDEDAAKQGFKTLFSGKMAITGLGDEANSFRRGREVEKVSMRQGKQVLSISRMGGEFQDDDLQKLEMLLRQAVGNMSTSGSAPAAGVDAACQPVIQSGEAKLGQAAWHSVVEGYGLKLESIKVGGQFFMNMDGKWLPGPDMTHAEKVALGMLKDGTIKLLDCKEVGTETLDGVEMTLLEYRSESKELGSGMTKLYIGKADGLPYKSHSKTDDGQESVQTNRYKDVVAPAL